MIIPQHISLTSNRIIELYMFYVALCDVQMEDDEALQWQKALYKKIGSKKGDQNQQNDLSYAIERVLAMSKVLFGLHLVSYYPPSLRCFHKLHIYISVT